MFFILFLVLAIIISAIAFSFNDSSFSKTNTITQEVFGRNRNPTLERKSNYHPHFQLKECDPDAPCDSNSTDSEFLDPVAARAIAFGDITAEFISSYAVEFASVQATAGIGGDWVNIGMTSPTEEGPLNDDAYSYIESGRIRFVCLSVYDTLISYVCMIHYLIHRSHCTLTGLRMCAFIIFLFIYLFYATEISTKALPMSTPCMYLPRVEVSGRPRTYMDWNFLLGLP